jgi:hypothetical protein
VRDRKKGGEKEKGKRRKKKAERATQDQNQRNLDELMPPATKSRHRETTRAQEKAKEQQNRSQDKNPSSSEGYILGLGLGPQNQPTLTLPSHTTDPNSTTTLLK